MSSIPSAVLDGLGKPDSGDDWGGALYRSPIGLFPFQAEGAARAFWQHTQSQEPAVFVLYETGLGKTHIAMAEAALMFEDNLVDQVIVVAESNKIKDWAEEDFPAFTRLSVGLYAGSIKKRASILAIPPQVLVMTYETGRNDICTFNTKSLAVTGSGPLTKALRGKRVLIVFDEFTKLRSRSSKLYVSWDYLINRVLRREQTGCVMVAGMTAGSVESSPEDHYNAGRLLAPWRAPNVADFYSTYVQSWDQYGNPRSWHNLSAVGCQAGVVPLSQMFGSITMRKRKSDLDVIAQFPSKVENSPRFIPLGDRHAAFYAAVEESFADADDRTQQQGFGLLRQVAGHPLSLLRSEGKMAKEIVAQVGEQGLRAMGAAKVEEMVAWAQRMGQQQLVIFTFYGQSILPLLDEALHQAGLSTVVNHGAMSADQRQVSQHRYKAGDAQVFLSSDAGARGLNLGVGSALLHYDLPLMYSIFDQRSNRIHRINSTHASVTIDSLVAGGVNSAGTVENAIAGLLVSRNEWSDKIIDDDLYVEGIDPGENVLTSLQRRAMLLGARRAAA